MTYASPMLVEIPDYGDKMTVDAYLYAVDCGMFIDYDGNGHIIRGDKMSYEVSIRPSNNGTDIPEGITHIMWFNK